MVEMLTAERQKGKKKIAFRSRQGRHSASFPPPTPARSYHYPNARLTLEKNMHVVCTYILLRIHFGNFKSG